MLSKRAGGSLSLLRRLFRYWLWREAGQLESGSTPGARCLLWAFFTFPGWNGSSRAWLGSLAEGASYHTRPRAARSLSHLRSRSRPKAHKVAVEGREMELSSGSFVKPLRWCALTKIINMLAPHVPPPPSGCEGVRKTDGSSLTQLGQAEETGQQRKECEKNLAPKGPGHAE